MPATINGIGTRYYGKQNVEVRSGMCAFCHRSTELSCYDTRLWCVVLFIPVIPLGKRRILDYCPHCTRHRSVDLGGWEKLKQEKITEQMARVEANPQDAHAAMGLCATLAGFGQSAQAAQTLEMLRARFPNDAQVQLFIGSMLERQGKAAESIPHYERAHHLDPQLPEAKVAVGLSRADQGRVDEAWQLLRFLEEPEQAENVGSLYPLALAYQKAGRHKEALALFSLLMQRLPGLGQDKTFREAVRISERCLGVKGSALPRPRLPLKRVLGWGAAAFALLGLAGSNYYISHNRTLYVVSGLDEPVTVSVRSHGEVTVQGLGFETVTLPEGPHVASVSGAMEQTYQMEIRTGYWDRWFKDPVFVLNVGGSAVLMWEQISYAEDQSEAGPYTYRLDYGRTFARFDDVDYAFQEFPEQLSVDSRTRAVNKIRVDVFRKPIGNLLYWQVGRQEFGAAAQLAEWHLGRHPEETDLLQVYLYAAHQANRETQARDFLAQGVQRRPIQIPWHRAYQTICERELPVLVAEYEALLQAEPTNSALLYLRGRLAGTVHETVAYADRAIAADPQNPFAHLLLGAARYSMGDWASARKTFATAAQLSPQEDQFQEVLLETRLALREFPSLETELRAVLATNSLDYNATAHLCGLLVAQGQKARAELVLSNYVQRLQRKYPEGAARAGTELRQMILYAAGDFKALEKQASQSPGLPSRTSRFRALLELGRVDEAVTLFPLDDAPAEDPFHYLTVSLVWRDAGKVAQAASWRQRAVDLASQGDAEYRLAAQWLERGQPVPLNEVLSVSLLPSSKAILMLALAQQFPQQSREYAPFIKKLNFKRSFPYHLVNRLTDKLLTD